MKYSLFFIALICFFTSQGQVFQDSVMLLDGKTYRGNVVEETDEFLSLNSFSLDGESEGLINIAKYRVFSYTQEGKEKVVYNYEPDTENFLTVEQTRKAALGSYDGKNFYDTKAVFYSAGAITLGFCLMDTYLSKSKKEKIGNPELKAGLFGRSPSIWPIASVLVLPIGFAIPSTKVRPKNLMNGIRGDQYYYAGFNSTARQRRSFAALKGAASGLVLGYASYFIFHPNPF